MTILNNLLNPQVTPRLLDLNTTVTSIDLTITDADLKGFIEGFTDGKYGYFVPSFGKITRVDLSDFSTVNVLDLTSTDADLKGFDGRY